MIRTKNIFITIAFGVLAFVTASAQINIAFEADTVDVILEELETGVVAVHGDVTNTSGAPLTLMCTRTFEQTATPFNYPYVAGEPGSYERFCWGDFCFPHGTDASPSNESMMVSIANGATNSSFIADFYPNGVTGTTTMQYCFHTADDAVSVCGTITFIVSTSSIEDATANADILQSIYPNPLTGNGWVDYDVPAGKTAAITVRDVTGRILASYQNLNSNGKVSVSAADLSSGLCFVTIEVEGVIVATEQVLVIK